MFKFAPLFVIIVSGLVSSLSSYGGPRNLSQETARRQFFQNLHLAQAPWFAAVRFMTDNELLNELNQQDRQRLEIGAAESPICRGDNCILVDHNPRTLMRTRQAFSTTNQNTRFIVSDVMNIGAFQNHISVSTIIARCVPFWETNLETNTQILAGLASILAPGGSMTFLTMGYSPHVFDNISTVFHFPMEAAAQLGFHVQMIATPTMDGIVLSRD